MINLKSHVISKGVVVGKVLNYYTLNNIKKRVIHNPLHEQELFKKALEKSIDQLYNLKRNHEFFLNQDTTFIDAHMLILQDNILYKEVCDKIEKEFVNAEFAFLEIIDRYIDTMSKNNNSYLKERSLDFIDIKNRILGNLFEDDLNFINNEDTILIIDELLPSLILNFPKGIRGIIAYKGGETSHSAILCKDMKIPFIISPPMEYKNDEFIILDGNEEKIIYKPSNEVIENYQVRLKNQQESLINTIHHFDFEIFANLSSNHDIDRVLKHNLKGVGLYRTEFIFMAQDQLPSLEQQTFIYQEVLSKLAPKPVIIRTIDIGDDKQLPYLFLNKKSAQNSYLYQEILNIQIKALILANTHQNLKIMFPMIETIEEFRFLKSIVQSHLCELKANHQIEIGIMLETKKALETLDKFREVDFISIGTNDLLKELYGISRENIQDIQDFLDDIIHELKKAVNFAKENNIPLSICGELAANKQAIARLVEIGIDRFSVNLNNLNTVVSELNKLK